jgi:hypothetical protein
MNRASRQLPSGIALMLAIAMKPLAFLVLFGIAPAALAQDAAPAALQSAPQLVVRTPSPEEQAFAKLPADIRSMLAGVPAAEAMRKVELARQQLIALGVPYPSPEQRRAVLQRVLNPRYGAVESASAGTTTFPPLSPLVVVTPFSER